jgi:hypothetical protein
VQIGAPSGGLQQRPAGPGSSALWRQRHWILQQGPLQAHRQGPFAPLQPLERIGGSGLRGAAGEQEQQQGQQGEGAGHG